MNQEALTDQEPRHPGGVQRPDDEPLDPRWLPGHGTNRALVVAARERGLSVWRRTIRRGGRELPRLLVGDGKKSVIFHGGYFNISNWRQCRISMDKQKARELLHANGCNAPRGLAFQPGELDKALEYSDELGYPVFIKPIDGRKGRGVAKIHDQAELEHAWEGLQDQSRILIEEYFDADEYRFSCVAGEVVAVVKRIPANVTGDGRHTIEELVRAKNVERAKGFATPQIKVDQTVLGKLSSLGLTLESVPAEGETVFLRDNSNVSTGGDSVDYTDRIHPGYFEAINKAARLFSGIVVAGWDIFIKDINAPPTDDNWAVCEVNHAPMISLHHYPWEGEPRDVAGKALDYVFGADAAERPPAAGGEAAAGLRDLTGSDTYMRRLLVRGRVQMVGFRQWLSNEAGQRGLDGWVRNRSDGAVEAILAGPEDDVRALAALCMRGPESANVTSLHARRWGWPVKTGFRILPDRKIGRPT